MSKTLDGLRSSLGRTASGVVAIGEMQADALLAELSDAQKTELAAKLTPAAKADTLSPDDGNDGNDGDDDENCPKCKGTMKDGKCSKCSPDQKAADAAASARDPRVAAVAAGVANDDACKGKADLALAMLADDDFAGLSGSALVKMIARTPVHGANASGGDPEAAARAEMKEAIAGNSNSRVDANDGKGSITPTENSASLWDQAIARVSPRKVG